MSTQAYADWSVWSGPFLELQQINQAATEKVVRECIAYYSDGAAQVVKSAQTMQRVSSPEDFFATQLKLLTQQGEKTLEFYQNIFQIYQDAIKDHSHWTENKVATAMKTAGKAAGSMRKQAEDN